jgi:hypothetical protein
LVHVYQSTRCCILEGIELDCFELTGNALHKITGVQKRIVSRDVTQWSLVQVYRSFWGTYFFTYRADSEAQHACNKQCYLLSLFFLTLKMEAVRSSETSLNFYTTKWRHVKKISVSIVADVDASDQQEQV